MLVLNFDALNLKCLSEVKRDTFYRGIKFGSRRLDISAEEKVSIELKTVSDTNSSQAIQIINYLNLFRLDVGLLLNFGKSSLDFRRFVYEK